MEYEAVIGLEVHVQLNTKTKIFCNCSTQFGAEPNSHVCPVCMGQPGVLPVLNEKVLEKGIRAALAIHCSISEFSKFDRKHYFYPDLPKNFQISQYDKPISYNGYIPIRINGSTKNIGVTRLHLEEDAGKLIHSEDASVKASFVDYNRTGTALAEIVSEPDMHTPQEAYEYLTMLKSVMQYINVSDCNMEEGSLRCDANISLRPVGQEALGTKTEVKNLNSFRNVEKALAYEIKRQTKVLNEGGRITQETRLWDVQKNVTKPMRSKEGAHDYLYFPEPDLVPIIVSREWIEKLKAELPELPYQKLERYISEYELSDYDAHFISNNHQFAAYFESALDAYHNPKGIANWIMGDISRIINEGSFSIEKFPVQPDMTARLVKLLDEKVITSKAAKIVFETMLTSSKMPEDIVAEKGLRQVSDIGALEKIIDTVILSETDTVHAYKNGKTKVIGALLGAVMKESKGTANPQRARELLEKKLTE